MVARTNDDMVKGNTVFAQRSNALHHSVSKRPPNGSHKGIQENRWDNAWGKGFMGNLQALLSHCGALQFHGPISFLHLFGENGPVSFLSILDQRVR